MSRHLDDDPHDFLAGCTTSDGDVAKYGRIPGMPLFLYGLSVPME